MNENKVLVGMSGGVDSAVSALLLKNAGYVVGGITMKVWSDTENVKDEANTSSDENIADAKKIADLLGIPHHSVALGDTFRKEVIDRFISDYAQGRTPNPCVECNRAIKFGSLFVEAQRLGYEFLATGHYARIIKNESGDFLLKKARDESKDQSYFLWSIKKELLGKILFPLGDYTKPEIREFAAQAGFSNAHRSDSQDICFIPDGDYAQFIEKHSDLKFPTGNFVDIKGNVLGKHGGIINYTIGQRKGLGIAMGYPIFVGDKNAQSNTVTLCSDGELYKREFTAGRVNLLADNTLSGKERLLVKIRYRHTPSIATVSMEGDRLRVIFDEPQRAIASGQSAVLYDGDTVVGGGIID